MASITKRNGKNGVTYKVVIRLKGQPTQTASFKRKTDADKWVASTESAIREGRYFIQSIARKYTFNDLLEDYLKRVMIHKAKKSQETQGQQLSWWSDRIGKMTLANLTPDLIAGFRDELMDTGRSNATTIRYLAALSHTFTYAIKEKRWMEDNPCLKVTKPKESKGRVRYFTDDERTRFLNACRESTNSLLYPAVMVSLCTGMRLTEQMTLTWQQIDLNTGRIVLIETKNGERRTVIATGPALDELKKLSKVRHIDNPHIFPGKVVGKPIELKKPFHRALNLAEIEDFHWHDMRHCFASELAMSGATLAELAEAMGHKTLNMVKRYAHLTEGHISTVVERMTAKVFGHDI